MAVLVCGCRSRDSASSRGIVSWVDQPAATAPAPANARSCRAEDLTERPDGGNGPGFGISEFYLAFTNISATACVLTGSPAVIAIAQGHAPITASYNPEFSDGGYALNMSPHQTSFLVLDTEYQCLGHLGGPADRRVLAHNLAVVMPGGGILSFPYLLDVTCGLGKSRFGGPISQLSTLQVSISLPATATRGGILNYVAILKNPTAGPVPVEACPGYQESLPDLGINQAYELNCDTVHAIDPGGDARYSMRLLIPSGAPDGTARVCWELTAFNADPNPNTCATIRIK